MGVSPPVHFVRAKVMIVELRSYRWANALPLTILREQKGEQGTQLLRCDQRPDMAATPKSRRRRSRPRFILHHAASPTRFALRQKSRSASGTYSWSFLPERPSLLRCAVERTSTLGFALREFEKSSSARKTYRNRRPLLFGLFSQPCFARSKTSPRL